MCERQVTNSVLTSVFSPLSQKARAFFPPVNRWYTEKSIPFTAVGAHGSEALLLILETLTLNKGLYDRFSSSSFAEVRVLQLPL